MNMQELYELWVVELKALEALRQQKDFTEEGDAAYWTQFEKTKEAYARLFVAGIQSGQEEITLESRS